MPSTTVVNNVQVGVQNVQKRDPRGHAHTLTVVINRALISNHPTSPTTLDLRATRTVGANSFIYWKIADNERYQRLPSSRYPSPRPTTMNHIRCSARLLLYSH
jgi:hypothetical protein